MVFVAKLVFKSYEVNIGRYYVAYRVDYRIFQEVKEQKTEIFPE